LKDSGLYRFDTMATRKFWIPMITSLAVTPIAILLGIGSAGAGHGDYCLAMLLFPYTMLSAMIFNSITLPFTILAIIQFPFYGFVLGGANEKGRLVLTAIILCLLHGVASAIMLLSVSET
jgi:hypothetical protein